MFTIYNNAHKQQADIPVSAFCTSQLHLICFFTTAYIQYIPHLVNVEILQKKFFHFTKDGLIPLPESPVMHFRLPDRKNPKRADGIFLHGRKTDLRKFALFLLAVNPDDKRLQEQLNLFLLRTKEERAVVQRARYLRTKSLDIPGIEGRVKFALIAIYSIRDEQTLKLIYQESLEVILLALSLTESETGTPLLQAIKSARSEVDHLNVVVSCDASDLGALFVEGQTD